MWDLLIKWSLKNRNAVFAIGAIILFYGIYTAYDMRVDALPDITAPTVTIITESRGMAPDEVENLITFPLETALNGAPGLRRVRSKSAIGLSIIWAEFKWDVDQYLARQIVSERLQIARNQLPPEAENPVMAPMTSIMGEIMVVGLYGDGSVSELELRDMAEWEIARRLLGISGVAQVTPLGGKNRQVQIVLKPEVMNRLKLGHEQVIAAVEGASANYPGGFFNSGKHEYVIRGIGRAEKLEELEKMVVAKKGNAPILLGNVADVRYGFEFPRGAASANGKSSVLLTIQKQPDADTLALTGRIDSELDSIEKALPKGMKLFREGFRQETFINRAISNVMQHIFESSILVIFVLFLFLANKRAALISLTALPLSLLTGILVIKWLGYSINTMTLGGFAIAIGALVDDAIIDVENVFRRLRQRAALPPVEREGLLETVFKASSEIRSSIVYANVIITVVFVPLFFLTGLEGRLMLPLGIAYVVSIAASLFVAVTITPAMCLVMFRNLDKVKEKEEKESRFTLFLKRIYAPLLDFSIKHAKKIAVLSLAGTVASVFIFTSFGRNFMPHFNEGSFSIAAFTVPGVSLEQSDRMMKRLDKSISDLEFVRGVTRRTGRGGEKDEHGHDVNASGMDIMIDSSKISREEAEMKIREVANSIPGINVIVTQPISFRIAHMNTGAEASLALKIFGDDLGTLRKLAKNVKGAVDGTEGLVDLKVEQQTDIPQIVIKPDYASLATLGIQPGTLTRFVETAFNGTRVGRFFQKNRSYDMTVRYPDDYLENFDKLKSAPLTSDGERMVTLDRAAKVRKDLGPNMIQRENVQRRIMVTGNVFGRDAKSVVEDMKEKIEKSVKFPKGYYIVYGGDFESEARATKTIGILSLVALFAIFLILWSVFSSVRDALLIMVNQPLALMGGTVAVFFMDSIITTASLVGFITLFGIATRNGIIMVSHYRHLMTEEGASFSEAVRRGSMERLVPVMMTAMTTALALIPIAFALDEPGNEIQAPMALVILGGIVTSTILNMVVVPALYHLFGKKQTAQAS